MRRSQLSYSFNTSRGIINRLNLRRRRGESSHRPGGGDHTVSRASVCSQRVHFRRFRLAPGCYIQHRWNMEAGGSTDPLRNSGADLQRLAEDEIRDELKGSFRTAHVGRAYL